MKKCQLQYEDTMFFQSPAVVSKLPTPFTDFYSFITVSLLVFEYTLIMLMINLWS